MATIFGDVQYSQVMGHLPTPDSRAYDNFTTMELQPQVELAHTDGENHQGWSRFLHVSYWFMQGAIFLVRWLLHNRH